MRGCYTTKQILDTLKEKNQGNERTKKIYVTQCLSELSDFKQKENETIKAYYVRLNELIFRCSGYGVVRTTLEFNLTFILGLRKEYRNICLMIKTQENFDTYSLSDVYNILKAQES